MDKIATWLSEGYAEKLMKAAHQYWQDTRNWVVWAIQQKDEQQSVEPILGLLAWERLTDRLPDESVDLYRRRVQHALVNTMDAGEIASVKDIFGRLGIDVLRVRERIDGRDWDIIAIDFSDSVMSQYAQVLPSLIQLYGRACRRYEFSLHNFSDVDLQLGGLDVSWDHCMIPFGLQTDVKHSPDFAYGGAFVGSTHDTSEPETLPLLLEITHPITCTPHYGFVSFECNASIAEMEPIA
ncbi:hypothetical protein [Algicola sagamiensis]|uniref:hypothetical protein n=1 Tax=Algicola sagamiensis TaxID=163869 RepID=UPI0003630D94|nr:hypothetical protein [Algicola sagamiensis]